MFSIDTVGNHCVGFIFHNKIGVDFHSKTLKELNLYLKERGVSSGWLLKTSLVEWCNLAAEIGLEVDPDGLLEDWESVIHKILVTCTGSILLNSVELNTKSNVHYMYKDYIIIFGLYYQ